jgi:CRP-like cAMP-binding protein
VVYSGAAFATNSETQLRLQEYGVGDFFGEMALVNDKPRGASVIAEGATECLELKRDGFLLLKGKCADVLNAFMSGYKTKMNMLRAYKVFLNRVPLFASLDERGRLQIASKLQPRLFVDGAAIVNEGDHGNSMFIVETGNAVVSTKTLGELQTFNEGDFFGELALANDDNRKATVRAQGAVTCLELKNMDFLAIAESNRSVNEVITQRRSVYKKKRQELKAVKSSDLESQHGMLLQSKDADIQILKQQIESLRQQTTQQHLTHDQAEILHNTQLQKVGAEYAVKIQEMLTTHAAEIDEIQTALEKATDDVLTIQLEKEAELSRLQQELLHERAQREKLSFTTARVHQPVPATEQWNTTSWTAISNTAVNLESDGLVPSAVGPVDEPELDVQDVQHGSAQNMWKARDSVANAVPLPSGSANASHIPLARPYDKKWSELSWKHKSAGKRLGFSESSWPSQVAAKAWAQLSEHQRIDAASLGITEDEWTEKVDAWGVELDIPVKSTPASEDKAPDSSSARNLWEKKSKTADKESDDSADVEKKADAEKKKKAKADEEEKHAKADEEKKAKADEEMKAKADEERKSKADGEKQSKAEAEKKVTAEEEAKDDSESSDDGGAADVAHKMKWSELSKSQKGAGKKLGFTEMSWPKNTTAIGMKSWSDLSKSEKYSAGNLGFNESSWSTVKPEEEEHDDEWDGENPLSEEVSTWAERIGFGHLAEILEDEGAEAVEDVLILIESEDDLR